MTTHNQPQRPHKRNHPPHSYPGRPSSERESVPHARDELERERELYSAHDPNRDPATPTPAQKWNEAHNSWHGWQGTGSIPAVSAMRAHDTARKPSGTGSSRGTAGGRASAGRSGAGQGTYRSTGATGSLRPRGHNGYDAPTGTAASNTGRVFAGSSRELLAEEASVASEAAGANAASTAPSPTASASRTAGAHGNSPRKGATGGIPVTGDAAVTGSIPAAGSTSSTGSIPAAGSAAAADRLFGTDGTPAADRASATGNIPIAEGASATGNIPITEGASATGSMTASDVAAHPSGNTVHASSANGTPIPPRKPAQKPAAIYGANNRYQSPGSISTVRQTHLTRAGLIAALAVVVIAIIGVFAFQNYEATKAIAVTLNGETVTVEGDQRSPEGILDAGIVSVTPGNYVAVDQSVMREGEGTRATVTINGEKTDDLSTHLEEGDEIKLENGTDVMESFTEGGTEVLPYETKITGTGAVHQYINEGKNGEKVTRTGDESGIQTETVTQEPVNRTVQCYNVDTGGDKVIALTFDDGPWDSSTEKILDILDENDAKATFFTVGYKIPGHEDLVKRASEAGHEIGTHTWDHAEGSGKGVSLIKMSTDERKDEVTKGLKAIEDATGAEASTIFRAPGGNFDDSVATDLQELISAEIGWNIDTNDWQKPGASTIAKRIKSAGPGNIILMHDGGGDRSQTVAALKEALPALKEQGYTFVTVQELIEKYPYKES